MYSSSNIPIGVLQVSVPLALVLKRYFNSPSTLETSEYLRRWWRLYGSTPAAGLSSLLLAESSHFPELARHYQDEVIGPAHELLRRVVQRGIDRGEFRPVPVERLVHLVVAPLLQMVTWQHALGHCCPHIQEDEPMALIELHADLLIRGLQPEPLP